MFNAYLQERKGMPNPETFTISQIKHRNFHAIEPQAGHRQFSGDDDPQDARDIDVSTASEAIASTVDDVERAV